MADPLTLQTAMRCIRCGEPATAQFTIDPDVTPWRSCEACLETVRLSLCAALQGYEDIAQAILKGPTLKSLSGGRK